MVFFHLYLGLFGEFGGFRIFGGLFVNQLTGVNYLLSRPGPWNKSLNFVFPTKYVIPKSLKGYPLAK